MHSMCARSRPHRAFLPSSAAAAVPGAQLPAGANKCSLARSAKAADKASSSGVDCAAANSHKLCPKHNSYLICDVLPGWAPVATTICPGCCPCHCNHQHRVGDLISAFIAIRSLNAASTCPYTLQKLEKHTFVTYAPFRSASCGPHLLKRHKQKI